MAKSKKKKKKNKKPLDSYLQQYEFGTDSTGAGVDGQVFDMASDALMGMTTSAVSSMFETIMGKSAHPKTFDFTANQNQLMANGGQIKYQYGTPNAEVEGEEVAQTPNGELIEFEGPTHEQGGIEVNLPNETKIFSKRLQKAGQSMAKRKMKREKAITKLEKALEETPHDKILLQTLERVKEKNSIQEQGDMMIQESMNVMENAQGVAGYLKKYGGKLQYNYKHGGTLPKYANGGGFPIIGGMNMANLMNQMQDQYADYLPEDFGYEDIAKMPKFGGDVKRVQQSIKDYQQSFKDANIAQGVPEDFGVDEIYDFGGVDDVLGPKTKGFFDDPSRRQGYMEYMGMQEKPEGATEEGYYSPRNVDRYVSSTKDVPTTPLDISGAQQGLNIAASSSYPETAEIQRILGLAGEPYDDAMFDRTYDKLSKEEPWDDSADGQMIMDALFNAEQLEGTPTDETTTVGATDETTDAGQDGYEFTKGDRMGMLGTKIAGLGPMMTSLINRAGDTPNINAYLNYGKRGLNTLESTKGMLGQVRDETLRDIKLKSDTARKRSRGSARSVNTLRGLEQMSNAQEQETTSNIYSNYAKQLSGVLGQMSQAQTQQDRMVMAGEQARDLADRQDRDNFFTQLNKDIGNYGTSMQKMGKDLNVKQGDKDFLDLLPQMSQYGLGMRKDKNGKWEMFHSNSGKKATKKEVASTVKKAKKAKKKEVETVDYDYSSFIGGLSPLGPK